jgi:endonuclease/exonuclease/phosphatase family metal-dependent hydrolase
MTTFRTLHRFLLCSFSAAVVACAPDVPAGADDGVTADTIRILAYNRHHGEGMDSIVDLERIAAIILALDPDLVALQEVDSVATRTMGVDQAAELGRLTSMQHVFGGFMPYQGGMYGMAVLSRLPIEEAHNHRLPDGAEPRTALGITVTTPAGHRVRFVGIHFYRTEEERLAQAIRLEALLADDDTPTILAGDFNSEPGTAVMTHLASSWEFVDKGEDSLTFSSFDPVREIDFVLLRPRGHFLPINERLLVEPVASDHRPVVVELAIRE